jgi:hypothetical protein
MGELDRDQEPSDGLRRRIPVGFQASVPIQASDELSEAGAARIRVNSHAARAGWCPALTSRSLTSSSLV